MRVRALQKGNCVKSYLNGAILYQAVFYLVIPKLVYLQFKCANRNVFLTWGNTVEMSYKATVKMINLLEGSLPKYPPLNLILRYGRGGIMWRPIKITVVDISCPEVSVAASSTSGKRNRARERERQMETAKQREMR